jgi:hypothetical protein
MKTNDRSDAGRLTVGHHDSIRRELLSGLLAERDFDEIDLEIQADPYNGDPPSKRSDKELARTLAILDSLEVSTPCERGKF